MRSGEHWARLPEPLHGKRMDEPQGFPARTGDPVTAFGELMRRELAANAHKGDRDAWRNAQPKDLLLQVSWHMIKLGAACRAGDLGGVAEYSADIANLAMMIADTYGLL